MDTAASPLPIPVAREREARSARYSPERLARRARDRRQVQVMIAVVYLIDALLLLIYAYAGTIPMTIVIAYTLVGLAPIAIYLPLSEFGYHERFKDHYLVAPQSTIGMLSMLVFAYAAPQVGVLFLCNLFIVFGFGALRRTARQTAMSWTVMTLGLAVLFLWTDTPVAIPHGNDLERFATMMVFALTIGRSMFLGILAASMQQSLYQNGEKLKQAYKRIEELAELDELTGSYNRRCIMRMLDEEIARATRSGSPCTIALIDLDWFKRVNDAYGHPTGDEVLRTFAISVFANIRNIDRFGRYGGEEFLLILPQVTRDDATGTLDRLRTIIAELDWSAFSPGMRVTISAGIATLKPNEGPDTLLARADSALYSAKARGRNCIVSV